MYFFFESDAFCKICMSLSLSIADCLSLAWKTPKKKNASTAVLFFILFYFGTQIDNGREFLQLLPHNGGRKDEGHEDSRSTIPPTELGKFKSCFNNHHDHFHRSSKTQNLHIRIFCVQQGQVKHLDQTIMKFLVRSMLVSACKAKHSRPSLLL